MAPTTSRVPVLGFVSGKLQFLEMLLDSLSRMPGGSVLRFATGLGGGNSPLIGAGGDLPSIRLFNENGMKIVNVRRPGIIMSGDTEDVTLSHRHYVNNQAAYALFGSRENSDPICIAYLGIAWPDGSKYGWVGDWGRQCGSPWYYSNVYVPGTDVKADCMWLDQSRHVGGFQLHWSDFSVKHNQKLPEDEAGQKKMVDWYCKVGPPFRISPQDPNEIVYWKGPKSPPGGGAIDHDSIRTTNFTLTEGEDRTNGRNTPEESITPLLVISDTKQHSVEDLCNSDTSIGPDLLSLYSNKFCRMSDKTIWPVCDTVNVTENCFDISRNILSTNLSSTGFAVAALPYSNVLNWTAGTIGALGGVLH